ncbi:MAG: OsmC family protein [Candidatus Dormibacteraceae bacterium]
MTASAERKTYTARARVTNRRPTLREVSLPGLDSPLRVGFHTEVADVYGIPPGSYEEAAATYDYLAGTVAGCLTGVLSGMLEARGVPTGDGRLTAEATAESQWRDRVLRVTGIHVHYTLHAQDADPEVVQRVHEQHVRRCSMAQSVAGAIEITTNYELS